MLVQLNSCTLSSNSTRNHPAVCLAHSHIQLHDCAANYMDGMEELPGIPGGVAHVVIFEACYACRGVGPLGIDCVARDIGSVMPYPWSTPLLHRCCLVSSR